MNDARRQKLHQLIYSIRTDEQFSLDWAKSQCHDVSPAYVTRILRKLAKDGHLHESLESKVPVYRWIAEDMSRVETWIDRQVYGEQVKQTPESDRPRELLLRNGTTSLTDAQLIAILIRVGVVGESAIQAGTRIANRFQGEKLGKLLDASLIELKNVSKAIRKDSFSQIMAGIELGRRVASLRAEKALLPTKIRGSEDAIAYCMRAFARLASDGVQEEFHIVTLDTQHTPINNHLITMGTLDASLVHPREVFRAAIRDSASAILLVHNHPSGDPTPSREDFAVTDRLTKVGELVGIRILDHIIVAKHQGRSILADK